MIFGYFLVKVAILTDAPSSHPALNTHSLSLLRFLCHSNLIPMGALQSKGKSAPSVSRPNQSGGWEGIHSSCTSDL